LAKTCFSACGLDHFQDQLRATGRRQILLAGIETHICVYQTARDLLDAGYHVEASPTRFLRAPQKSKHWGCSESRKRKPSLPGLKCLCLNY
jgi:hypothetical protein